VKFLTIASMLFLPTLCLAEPLPGSPADPDHPGSKVYSYGVVRKDFTCQGRAVNVFLPTGGNGPQSFPVVVYGHGQSLGVSSYKATFEHLAKKGIASVFPAFDTGFFDQDWNRMGRDYVTLTDCVAAQLPELDSSRVVYAGHSKGAYVAQIAAGLAPGMSAKSAPRAIVLFAPAGFDSPSLSQIDPRTALTVVFSDRDTIVKRDLSESIFSGAKSHRRQLILMKSYSETTPALNADHFWPVTEKGMFGGGPEGPLHYHGSWKWLVAAARDLSGGRFEDPYLYGQVALEKGVPQMMDDVKRNW